MGINVHLLGCFRHVLRWLLLRLRCLIHHDLLILGHLGHMWYALLWSNLSSSFVPEQLAVFAMLTDEITGASIPPDEYGIHHGHTDLAAALSEALLNILLVKLGHDTVGFIGFWFAHRLLLSHNLILVSIACA